MDTKHNIVLVPTDFSDVIEYAIDHAIGICKQQKYKLTLLHIINKEMRNYLKKENLSIKDVHEKLDLKVKEISNKFEIVCDFILREGSIFSTIGEIAKEIGANKLVLGTHGKVGLQKFTGSYALKVIESSPAPVIVVQKRGFREGYKNIILPIDDTSESKQKVKWAINISRKFNSIVHIYGINVSDDYRMSKIRGNMTQIKKFFDQNGIIHTDKMAERSPTYTSQLMTYAELLDADLILIMTNPGRVLPNFIVGKWEEQILFNELMIPIMAINPIELNIVVGGF